MINIFAFSIVVQALNETKDQVTWNYGADGKLMNATVLNGGNGISYYDIDWIRIKTLFNWGIWKLIGQVDLTSNGR